MSKQASGDKGDKGALTGQDYMTMLYGPESDTPKKDVFSVISDAMTDSGVSHVPASLDAPLPVALRGKDMRVSLDSDDEEDILASTHEGQPVTYADEDY